MAEMSTLFWDVGGVLLTNGWDRSSRRRASQKFNLDWEDFQDRRELVISDFETGRLTREEHLERTIFYRSRPFSQEEFRAFMLGPNLNRTRKRWRSLGGWPSQRRI